MKDRLTRAEVKFLFSLAPGDQVEGQNKAGERWQGSVEAILHEHGILWIQTAIGERKLLDIQEHTIHPVGDSPVLGSL
jgi:hypothetical protein